MSWVAIAGGTIAAAGAVGSSLIASNSSKGSSGGAGGGDFPQLKAKFDKVNKIPGVTYNPKQGAKDFQSILPQLRKSANQITANQLGQQELVMPGAANQRRLASNVLQSYLRGEVPQDVVDFTNRAVAERTGGGFNPFTGGGQSQSDFARSIGRLSSDFTSAGLSAAPTWQQLSNSFITNPLQVSGAANQMAATRYQYDALNSNINQFNAGIDQFNSTGQYTGGMNDYRAGVDQYMANAAQQGYQSSQMSELIGTGANLAGIGIQAAFSGGNRGASIQSQRPTGYLGASGTFYGDLGQAGNYGRAQFNPGAQSPTGNFSLFGNPYKTGAT